VPDFFRELTNQKYTLRCAWCATEVEEKAGIKACPKCSGSLEVLYDYEKLRNEYSGIPSFNRGVGIWKYAPILPVDSATVLVSLGEGSTPYHGVEKIGASLSFDNLFIKDESRNPTCSFKDRKSAAAITKAVAQGFRRVTAATAGNAGSSVAAFAAKAGIGSYIFAFQGISSTKLAKLLAYGANVFLTSASTGDVLEFVDAVCNRYGLQNCSAASRYNPFVKEGAKTAVFEMFEQTDGSLPDWIVLPLGGGGNISAYFKGLKDLKALGLIEKFPKLVGVQGEGCAPVVEAFEKKLDPRQIPKIQNPKTIAHSILDDWAPDGDLALVAIRETKGWAVSVSDRKIVSAMKLLSEQEGIYAEPSSAVPLAALRDLLSEKVIDRNESVAAIITGFGLNQPDATLENYNRPPSFPLDVVKFGSYIKSGLTE
jgi:threonine synthase